MAPKTLLTLQWSDKSTTQSAEVVGYEGSIEWDPSKPDGTPRKLLDVSKIEALGWKPEIELRDGIASTYQWNWALFRSNLDFILSAKETVQSLEFVAQCLLYLPYLRCMPRRPLKTQRLSTPRIKAKPNKRSSTGALARRIPIIACESYITILREVSHQLVMS